MAQPLSKKDGTGLLYKRDPEVEAQIDEAINLDLASLKQRLQVTDQNASSRLRSECLVHLVRHGRRQNDQALMSAVAAIVSGNELPGTSIPAE